MAEALAKKGSVSSLTVHGNGITLMKFNGFADRAVLLDLPKRMTKSAVQTVRGFDSDGKKLDVTATVKVNEEDKKKGRGNGLVAQLVGKEVFVTVGMETLGRGTLMQLRDTQSGLIATIAKSSGEIELVQLPKEGSILLRDTKDLTDAFLADEKHEHLVVSASTELAEVEIAAPGNRWGVSYQVNLVRDDNEALGGLNGAIDVRVVWQNPLDIPFEGPVKFKSNASFACQPNLSLEASDPPAVFLGEFMASAAVGRTIERYYDADFAGAAPAIRRVALSSVDHSAGSQIGDFKTAATGVEFSTTLSVGAGDTVIKTAETATLSGPALVLIADLSYLDELKVFSQVPLECLRFHAPRTLPQGPATVNLDGEYLGSSPLQFANQGSEVSLPIRLRSDIVVYTETKKPEKKQISATENPDGETKQVTSEHSREVVYKVDNKSGGKVEVLIGHPRTSNDSRLVTNVELSKEDTATHTRFRVSCDEGTTNLIVTEVWTVEKTVKIKEKADNGKSPRSYLK